MTDPRLVAALEGLVAAHARDGQVPLIGIAGAQGSGKTTLARAAAARLGAAQFSLDDVYLDRAARSELARTIHPLFATRGPPLTHDLGRLARTVADLRAAGPDARTRLPAFDKRADEPVTAVDRPVFAGRPSAILIDGWCLGAMPQADGDLIEPVNALERDHDPDGVWRRRVNDALAGDYATAFAAFDTLLFLAAPSFEVVLDWRCEQEAETLGLAPSALPAGDRARIAGFVPRFERLTRSMLAGGVVAGVRVALDAARRVVGDPL